jgi:hypothetical protein
MVRMEKMNYHSTKPTKIPIFYWVPENSIKGINLDRTGEIQYIDGKKYVQIKGHRLFY